MSLHGLVNKVKFVGSIPNVVGPVDCEIDNYYVGLHLEQ